MGCYWDLSFKIKLVKPLPKNVFEVFAQWERIRRDYENVGGTSLVFTPDNHPFFNTKRWESLIAQSTFIDRGYCYDLTVEASINYGHTEIHQFVDYIVQYIKTRKKKTWLGWWCYEENRAQQHIYYFLNGDDQGRKHNMFL